MMIIKSPVRIDLAGGTLDIWPLSTIFAPSVCVNIAIDLFVKVKVQKVSGSAVVIEVLHWGKTINYYSCVKEKDKTLFHRMLDIFPVKGYRFTVDCKSPAGAGLGGSSALVIAFLTALIRTKGLKISTKELVDIAKNIEARHLGIPTGVQDYVASIKGGLSLIHSNHDGFSFKSLKINKKEIEKRVSLFYSGQSRISATANWLMFKKAIEGDKKTLTIFKAIAKNSLSVKKEITSSNYDKLGRLLDKENSLREQLGSAVIPASMKKLFKIAKDNGGFPKICGAGGGGCFIIWHKPNKKEKVLSALKEAGVTNLPFKLASPSIIIK